MRRRKLGRSGLEVSELGFGCGPTAGLMIRGTAEERRAAVAHALASGIDYFDTAPVYGDGLSEAHLGQALQELGAKPFVATKIALSFDELGDIEGAVACSVEASLKRLRLPRLALVQLHNRVGPARAPRPDIGSGALITVEDVLGPRGVVETLEKLRASGLVAQFGCCAFGGDMGCVAALIASGAFATILVQYSVANPSAWRSARPAPAGRDYRGIGARAASAGLGAIALRILEGGALAGDAARAIRFALANPEIATALLGFSDIAQIDAALRAAEPVA